MIDKRATLGLWGRVVQCESVRRHLLLVHAVHDTKLLFHFHEPQRLEVLLKSGEGKRTHQTNTELQQQV